MVQVPYICAVADKRMLIVYGFMATSDDMHGVALIHGSFMATSDDMHDVAIIHGAPAVLSR
jgi:hypothetical protein